MWTTATWSPHSSSARLDFKSHLWPQVNTPLRPRMVHQSLHTTCGQHTAETKDGQSLHTTCGQVNLQFFHPWRIFHPWMIYQRSTYCRDQGWSISLCTPLVVNLQVFHPQTICYVLTTHIDLSFSSDSEPRLELSPQLNLITTAQWRKNSIRQISTPSHKWLWCAVENVCTTRSRSQPKAPIMTFGEGHQGKRWQRACAQ